MERRRRDDAKEMAQRVKADQRQFGRGELKGVRVEHPSGNQPFLASFSDNAKMAFPFCIFHAQNSALLPIQRMVRVADLDPISVMMGSMLSLRSRGRRPFSPICRATPTGWRSRIRGARNAAAIPAAFRDHHRDRHVMSWNALLEPTLPPCFTSCSQATKPNRCLRCPPAAKTTPKDAAGRGGVSSKTCANPLHLACCDPKTHAPLTHADAVSLKSP